MSVPNPYEPPHAPIGPPGKPPFFVRLWLWIRHYCCAVAGLLVGAILARFCFVLLPEGLFWSRYGSLNELGQLVLVGLILVGVTVGNWWGFKVNRRMAGRKLGPPDAAEGVEP